MMDLEYKILNTITKGVDGISEADNIKCLDYFFEVMQRMGRLPIKVSQEQIEDWTPYVQMIMGRYAELTNEA